MSILIPGICDPVWKILFEDLIKDFEMRHAGFSR
jgi:hypothetical protein